MQQVYLNHAGTSWPKPTVVNAAINEAARSNPAEWSQRFEAAHRALAAYFSVEDPSQILLTPGCTSALSVGIADALLADGKRVLTSCWEHHAVHRPLLKLAAQGINLETMPAIPGTLQHPPYSIDLEALQRSLAVGDVGLIAMTAACNVTGELLPYEQVIELARRYGAMVVLDAAQIVGWFKMDLSALDADMVAFGGHKGLQGPWGIGGLYVNQSARLSCLSANCSLPMPGQTAQQRPGYCDVGSVDQLSLAGLHAAIKFLNQQDTAVNLAAGQSQVLRIRNALKQFERVRLFPDSPQGLPTLAFEIPGFSSTELASRLASHGVIVGSGLHCAPLAHETLGTAESGLVRLSVGIAQPDEQIDRAIDILCEQLGQLI